jgi:hypothetical protein
VNSKILNTFQKNEWIQTWPCKWIVNCVYFVTTRWCHLSWKTKMELGEPPKPYGPPPFKDRFSKRRENTDPCKWPLAQSMCKHSTLMKTSYFTPLFNRTSYRVGRVLFLPCPNSVTNHTRLLSTSDVTSAAKVLLKILFTLYEFHFPIGAIT